MPLISEQILQRYPYSIAMRIVGHSMEPTLRDGDTVLVDVRAAKPKTGDVVTAYVRGKGAICGRFRRTRGGAWLYKDNRNDPTWPRLFLGRTASDYAITGTVRCIVERLADDPELPTIMQRDVTPANGNTAPLSPNEIRTAGDRATFLFQLVIASLRQDVTSQLRQLV